MNSKGHSHLPRINSFEVSAIKTGQSELEEMITNTLGRQLKGIMALVQQCAAHDTTSTVVMKLPKSDESMSWMVYHYQFGVAADHCSWAAHNKHTHLLTILQDQAINILHSDPHEATYEGHEAFEGGRVKDEG
jgi:hypothetical protein